MQEQTHITFSIEQFNLLMEKICSLQNEVLLVKGDVKQIKSTYTTSKKTKKVIPKPERIEKLSASILKRGKKLV